MKELRLLTDEELNYAFDHALDEGVNFDHKPTQEEIFTVYLRAVEKAVLAKQEAK